MVKIKQQSVELGFYKNLLTSEIRDCYTSVNFW